MPVALFDLDNTLLEGDSEYLWCQFLLEKQVVGPDFSRVIDAYFRDYDLGSMDIFAYEAFFLQPLVHNPLEKMIALRSEYLKRIHKTVRQAMISRVQWHRTQKHHLLLITASNSFLAEPIARMLNIPNLICTEVEKTPGGYTNQITGIPAFQQGKTQRLDLWIGSRGLSLYNSWGYSDSINDLPLLNRVDHPVVVDPDPRLLDIAQKKHWTILL